MQFIVYDLSEPIFTGDFDQDWVIPHFKYLSECLATNSKQLSITTPALPEVIQHELLMRLGQHNIYEIAAKILSQEELTKFVRIPLAEFLGFKHLVDVPEENPTWSDQNFIYGKICTPELLNKHQEGTWTGYTEEELETTRGGSWICMFEGVKYYMYYNH